MDKMVVNPLDGPLGNESSGLENKTIIVTTILVINLIFCQKIVYSTVICLSC